MFSRSLRVTLAVIGYGAFLGLAGCGSTMMQTVKTRDVARADQAEVVFVRPTSFGGAIQFGLWDGDRLIGVLSANATIQYLTDPGEHVFIAVAENRSFVKATLASGKRYFVVAKPFPGVWKARVALEGVHKNDELSARTLHAWLDDLAAQRVIEEKVAEYERPRKAEMAASVKEFEDGKVKFDVLSADDNH